MKSTAIITKRVLIFLALSLGWTLITGCSSGVPFISSNSRSMPETVEYYGVDPTDILQRKLEKVKQEYQALENSDSLNAEEMARFRDVKIQKSKLTFLLGSDEGDSTDQVFQTFRIPIPQNTRYSWFGRTLFPDNMDVVIQNIGKYLSTNQKKWFINDNRSKVEDYYFYPKVLVVEYYVEGEEKKERKKRLSFLLKNIQKGYIKGLQTLAEGGGFYADPSANNQSGGVSTDLPISPTSCIIDTSLVLSTLAPDSNAVVTISIDPNPPARSLAVFRIEQ